MALNGLVGHAMKFWLPRTRDLPAEPLRLPSKMSNDSDARTAPPSCPWRNAKFA